MAVEVDFAYLRYLCEAELLRGPILEVGSRSWQGDRGNFRLLCEDLGIEWTGTDIVSGPGVDFTLDILNPSEVGSITRRWPGLILFNLLEHVFDPAEALRNAMTLLEDGGRCAIVTPTVWQLHGFPRDYFRPLPDFYEEYARRHGARIVPDSARWLVADQLMRPEDITAGGELQMPSSVSAEGIWGRSRSLRSRIVHRALNTTGRALTFPYTGYGLVLEFE